MSWLLRLFAVILFFPSPLFAAEVADDHPSGIRKMAMVYEHGRGVKKNYRKAYELYCKAALMSDVESAYHLGFIYFNGRGVSRNLSIALYWFRLAAKAGDPYARRMVIKFKDIKPTKDSRCRRPEPELTITAEQHANPNRQIVKSWVEKIAPNYGIDPELVMAVIQAESAFNPGALSNKNAQGLMQLIPATAERFGVKDTFNPIQNIKGGTAYLHWLMRHFNGNVEWVLAAYNAGEGAVERYKGVPPYRETQNYVKTILKKYPNKTHPIPGEHPQQMDAS
ncbi:transglycosylase SLT domain-containing protein [Methylotuvimicrobium sp. KM1]|uniref:transglycosylase SLT domain-containing protein n=1 Tax=Methylotuvimicrobium sp. KM1 TaxID=3377707 RepID=UPI00384C1269